MKKAVLSLIVMLAIGIIQMTAQRPPYIEFETIEYDYGTIKESDGTAVGVFNFKNTGGSALVITDVKPSCGCTSPEWTREPIAPGKSGYIKSGFDPANRPGVFNKTIRVTSNAENNTIILRIKGDVVPKEKGLEDFYPIEMGSLRFNTNHMAMQRISINEIKTDTVQVYNPSDKPVAISFQRIPAHLSIKSIPSNLKPKEKGTIIITYDAPKKNDWGFLIDRVPVVFNGEYDPTDRSKNLTISADIQDDFSKLSEKELANAPKVEFLEKVYDFGTLTQGETTSNRFSFKNTGKSDLIIRKVKTSCGCTAVAPDDKIIKPGQESKIDVTFRSAGKKGKQNQTVTIITNDPSNPQINLKVTGTVQVKS